MYTAKQKQSHRYTEQNRNDYWEEAKIERQGRDVGLRDTKYYE